jgi:hypothetical protein
MPSSALAIAKARDAARGSAAPRAHMRNEAGVLSCLIASASLSASVPAQLNAGNHSVVASQKRTESQAMGSAVLIGTITYRANLRPSHTVVAIGCQIRGEKQPRVRLQKHSERFTRRSKLGKSGIN